jgi:hypothetical protein
MVERNLRRLAGEDERVPRGGEGRGHRFAVLRVEAILVEEHGPEAERREGSRRFRIGESRGEARHFPGRRGRERVVAGRRRPRAVAREEEKPARAERMAAHFGVGEREVQESPARCAPDERDVFFGRSRIVGVEPDEPPEGRACQRP